MLRFLAVLVSVLLVPVSVSRADGLLHRLPEDRSFVKYDLELMLDGQPAPFPGSLTVKSVGSTFEDGEKCRWIELEFRHKPNDAEEQITVFKMLLPEKNLAAGKNPTEKIVRGWYRQNTGPVEQFTDTGSFATGPAAIFLSGPFKDQKKLEKQFEDSKLGNLECEGVSGALEHMMGDSRVKLNAEVRTHEKAPFGVVRAEYQFELLNNEGAASLKGTVRFKLADFGTDAISDLQDSQ